MAMIVRAPGDIITRLEDVIVPEVFLQYIAQRTAELSALYNSGIINHDPRLDALSAGGTKIQMPFWNDLEGEDERLTDDKDYVIRVDRITTGQEDAIIIQRAKGWSATDLSGVLAGSDPVRAIGNLISDHWTRRQQITLIYEMKGVFSCPDMEHATLDISGRIIENKIVVDKGPLDAKKIPAKTKTKGKDGTEEVKEKKVFRFEKSRDIHDPSVINPNALIDAFHILGDSQHEITGIVMHSKIYSQLQKLNLIDNIP